MLRPGLPRNSYDCSRGFEFEDSEFRIPALGICNLRFQISNGPRGDRPGFSDNFHSHSGPSRGQCTVASYKRGVQRFGKSQIGRVVGR